VAEYGFTQRFLNAVPELKKLVASAVAEGLEDDLFLEKLKATSWWRRLTDAQRRYQVLQYDNPREIQSQVLRQISVIERMLGSMGMRTSRAYTVQLARESVRSGWTEAEVRFAVGQRYGRGGAAPGIGLGTGLVGQANTAIDKLYGDYGMKVTAATRTSMIRNVLSGTLTVADYTQFVRDRAAAQYTAVADQINQGFTVRQIVDPYLQAAAEELGVNPATIDISNAMWSAPLQHRDKAGAAPREMTMDEWTAKLRTDTRYGWDKSQNAQRAAATFAGQLMGVMGARG
jgi:hypothetical protein